jgi:DNA integrity scanning protein DisA with diadenylate cyclase activity
MIAYDAMPCWLRITGEKYNKTLLGEDYEQARKRHYAVTDRKLAKIEDLRRQGLNWNAVARRLGYAHGKSARDTYLKAKEKSVVRNEQRKDG